MHVQLNSFNMLCCAFFKTNIIARMYILVNHVKEHHRTLHAGMQNANSPNTQTHTQKTQTYYTQTTQQTDKQTNKQTHRYKHQCNYTNWHYLQIRCYINTHIHTKIHTYVPAHLNEHNHTYAHASHVQTYILTNSEHTHMCFMHPTRPRPFIPMYTSSTKPPCPHSAIFQHTNIHT